MLTPFSILESELVGHKAKFLLGFPKSDKSVVLSLSQIKKNLEPAVKLQELFRKFF